jgi:hypothetical protein
MFIDILPLPFFPNEQGLTSTAPESSVEQIQTYCN